MAKKEDEAKAEKAKAFEQALSDYGDATKASNIGLMESKRLELLDMAGLKTKSSESNNPGNDKVSDKK